MVSLHSGMSIWMEMLWFVGYIYYESRRAVNALVHMDQSYEIFKAFCKPQKVSKMCWCVLVSRLIAVFG